MTEKRGQIFVNQGGRNQLCQLTSYYAPLNFIQKNDPTEISNVLYDAYGQSDQSYLGGYIFNDMDRSAYVFNTVSCFIAFYFLELIVFFIFSLDYNCQ